MRFIQAQTYCGCLIFITVGTVDINYVFFAPQATNKLWIFLLYHFLKGVDSSHNSLDVVAAAISLARTSGSVIAVSGAIDIVTDGKRVIGVQNGVPMLQKITASGCSVTALIAAFVAIDPLHVVEATACALSIFGLSGEIGMEIAKGPASLRMHLIDSLYGLDQDTILRRVSIVNCNHS